MSSASAGGTTRLGLLAEAGLLAVVAAGVLLDSRSYPGSLAEGAPGPAFFPRLLAVLLMGCAAWLAVRAARRPPEPDTGRSRGSAAPGAGGRRGARLALGAAWIAVFLLAWPRLGTVVSVPLLVAGLMWLTGERSRLVLIAVPLGFAAFIYLVFMVVLGVPLPSGF
ncbi:tripartite tricarboxylate transporter TctB family protein [Candidatus Palauibacter polyketidifaciens]|uniref:tripartite tricarboxylate transporter TctB family protein n=1 Tax=Candidatus Palauibacter polyketidifaciens TaxID=3056740 RepID=UPI00239F0D0F|nr:tripartite tricarboxylate transporter TctB family protein [Candidatus Palauibacter polyketidifaciens]MDE2719333.1 tripartite tricarboxylate transporter TctB family protein [Candidatus Palauibacter polyketidifaciens]